MLKSKHCLIFFILLGFGILSLGFVINGCGKMETQQSPVGNIAPSTDSSKGGSLYDKYKDKFPENLMEITADDMINKLTPYVIQSADGQTEEVYVPWDVAEEVVEQVEESYPKHDPEKYANEKAEEILNQNPSLQSIIMSGVGTSELDKNDILEKAGYTEEGFKEKVLEELEAKEKRIAAEKSYMIFTEFAEPEVQNQIKASVAEIQALINKAAETGQYISIKDILGKGPNYHEMRLLFRHPHYWIGTTLASINALANTSYRFGDYRAVDNKKGNSFQHSYWNVLLAKENEGAAWWGKRDALWWAEAFSSAHEEGASNPSKSMDLHNNRVGRRLYDQRASDKAVWIHIYFLWWRVASIHARNIAESPSTGTFQNILSNRVNDKNQCRFVSWNGSRFNENPGQDQLVYLWK